MATGSCQTRLVSDAVRDSYDAAAELYASLFLGELERAPIAKQTLSDFVELVAGGDARVVDLGCGPGHVVDYLSGFGLQVVGYDLSPEMVARARQAFPNADVRVGDFTALDIEAASVGGIVSRYSVIHLPPSQLDAVFTAWRELLLADAPLLVSFFGARSLEGHAEPFDHKVTTAYALFPATVASELEHCGFSIEDVHTQAIPEGGRPYDDAVILARKSPG